MTVRSFTLKRIEALLFIYGLSLNKRKCLIIFLSLRSGVYDKNDSLHGCANVPNVSLNIRFFYNGKARGLEFVEQKFMKTMEKFNPERVNSSSSSFEDNEIVHVTLPDTSTYLSVTTVLNYCKSKILTPYLRFLSFVGLRSFMNQHEICIHKTVYNIAYLLFAVGFMIVGYVLQYMSCFRRERGFCYMYVTRNKTLMAEYETIIHETCEASIIFSFILPSILHLVAYLHLIFVFRNTDDDQLPILMERVFLASTSISNGFISQRRLVRTLRVFFTISLIWLTLSFAVVNYMMLNGDVAFKWITRSPHQLTMFLKIVLVISTLWQDLIQCTIISNYCLQAELLRSFVRFMRERLLQSPVLPLEWMRDIEDFKKLLYYFNQKISPSVCLLIVMNLSYALSGTLWLFRYHIIDKETLPIFGFSLLNILLWAFMALAPFIQAARLSNSCEILKTVGQESRARPYVHQDTPTLELDSVLLYTTSLKINAQLFYLPITGRTLFFCLTIGGIVILTLGQCHYFTTS
ncbi:unnamed protein product [Phyllotreta striolata]|uniref:Uncharacterized protein n=1 Tax=Phyllotreta striolata TaxID=444603 RepID=A0A9N9XJ50_PHYSR|nr:unnamed protein product [Phyllotreta striolata]